MKQRKGNRKRTLVTMAVLLALLIGVLPMQGSSVFADTTKSYQDQIDAAKEKKKELEAAQKELEAKINQCLAENDVETAKACAGQLSEVVEKM